MGPPTVAQSDEDSSADPRHPQAAYSGGSVICPMLTVGAIVWAPMLFGLSLGFTSPAIDVMKDTLMKDGRRVIVPEDLIVFTTEEADWYGSLVNIGCIVGAVGAGQLSERLGRKWTIVGIAPLFAAAWLFTGLSTSFSVLLTCRVVLGVAVGVTSSVVPTYINEVAPTHLRGAFGTVFQIGVVFGIMLVYLFGAYIFIKDGICNWRHLACSLVLPSVALFAFGLLVPESPRWLASKGRLEQAERNLARLRGPAAAVSELEELRQSSAQAGSRRDATIADLLRNPRVVGIGLMLMVVQQCSGVNAIIFFQNTIFQDAGMSDPASLGFYVMLLQVLTTSLSVPLVDTAGRKSLLLTSALGMMVCCAGMCIFFLHNKEPSWLALGGSFAYIGFFSLGLGPVPWLMMSEIFPQDFRSLASSFGAGLNWFCSFLTTLSINPLEKAIGLAGVFAIYGCVLLLGVIFLAAAVPETKGRTLAEIERIFGIQRRDVALMGSAAGCEAVRA